jgi:hypothetical protein
MNRPNWLIDHLIRAGHMTESGVTRRARVRTCDRCGDVALVALDDDMCAFEVAADPHPLTALGEAMALLEQRRTFELTKSAGGYQLDRRGPGQITGRPAGTTPRADVLAEHRCRTPDPPPAFLADTSFAEHRHQTYEEIPF